jgi:aspartyl-tRNA(Asn)/glutamyl-tRNA(Gln) amidotransferase subunit B
VQPTRQLIGRLRDEVPELPAERIRRLEAAVGFEPALGLVASGRDRLYEGVAAAGAEPRLAANVLMNQFAGTGIDPAAVNAGELAKLIAARERIPRAAFDEALAASGDPGFSADRYLADAAIADVAQLDPVIDRILADNEPQVAAFRGGKEGVLGYLVGQVMKETRGKANPRVVNERLREKLNA